VVSREAEGGDRLGPAKAPGRESGPAPTPRGGAQGPGSASPLRRTLYWSVVGIPLAYGVARTLLRALELFS
jgi:hypothetical protein